MYIPVSYDILPNTIHLFRPFSLAHWVYLRCIIAGFNLTFGAFFHSSFGMRALAAKAFGANGYFFEVHPDPDHALSDGPNMLNLNDLEGVVKSLL